MREERKKVWVQVQGIQHGEDGEVDRSQTFSKGIHYHRGQTHYLLFDECLDGSNVSVRNLMKIQVDPGQEGEEGEREKREERISLEVTKTGPVQTHLTFSPGLTWEDSYRTSYGNHSLTVRTRQMGFWEGPDYLAVSAAYELTMGGVYVGLNEIEVTVREED